MRYHRRHTATGGLDIVDWIITAVALLSGVAAGMLLMHLTGNRDRQLKQLREALEQERREHAAYRREVSDHFSRTAVAVNRMTESYRSVHEELRAGAAALCDNAAAELVLASDEALLIPQPGDAGSAQSDTPEGTAPAADAGTTPSERTPPRDYADGMPDETPSAAAVRPEADGRAKG